MKTAAKRGLLQSIHSVNVHHVKYIFTADCLRYTVHIGNVETISKLHIYSCCSHIKSEKLFEAERVGQGEVHRVLCTWQLYARPSCPVRKHHFHFVRG